MEKDRILIFDVVRVICIFWIVGAWHMADYIGHSLWFDSLNYVTIGVLAVFTFLSGLFLGKSTLTPFAFYKRRLARFWFLLFISSLSFFVLGKVMDWRCLIGTITGLSCLGFPWARTLWYFSMMIMFYLITPFLTSPTKAFFVVFMKGFAIWSLMAFFSAYIENLDRLVLYFPYYLLGVILTVEKVQLILDKGKFFLVPFSLFVIWLFELIKENYYDIALYIQGFCVFILLFSICSIISQCFCYNLKKVICLMSYSSMCMYLFHRQVYNLYRYLFSSEGKLCITWAPTMFFSVVVVAYMIQYIYDKIINKYAS